jgi:hypothetical protein
MQKVTTQAEFDKALAAGDSEIEIGAEIKFSINIPLDRYLKIFTSLNNIFEFLGVSAPTIVSRGSSAPRIESWESSAPTIESWESSAPTIVSRGSSAPRIESWGSSAPTIEARGYVQLSLTGKITAKLGAKCHAVLHKGAKVKGGSSVKVEIKNGEDWCEYYGVEVKKGVAILYKGVRNDYASGRDASFFYKPGTQPKASQYDDAECSYGLHFVPHPRMAREFYDAPDMKWLACPVKVKDLLVFPEGSYPNKAKVQGVCAKIWEVNEDGEKL